MLIKRKFFNYTNKNDFNVSTMLESPICLEQLKRYFFLGFNDEIKKIETNNNFPPTNISTDKDGVTHLELALAGFKKEDIKVEIIPKLSDVADNQDYLDKYSGTINNSIGSIVEIARNKVDDDYNNEYSNVLLGFNRVVLLQVSGSNMYDKSECKNRTYYFRGITKKTFKRQFIINENSQIESANFIDGLLNITIKSNSVNQNYKTIEIN